MGGGLKRSYLHAKPQVFFDSGWWFKEVTSPSCQVTGCFLVGDGLKRSYFHAKVTGSFLVVGGGLKRSYLHAKPQVYFDSG